MKKLFILILSIFIIKYKFKTNIYLKEVKCPVKLFHGNKDEITYYGSSLKLKKLFKDKDELITIEGGHHNDLSSFDEFNKKLKQILK